MLTTAKSEYTPLDFSTWNDSELLVVTPKFQRRSVWSPAAKSYFIETIVKGFPSPPIYLRFRQSDDESKPIREVVDGQQRIRAVLEFMAGS